MIAERDLLLTGGRVVDPGQKLDKIADVWVRNGKVEAISPELKTKLPKDVPCEVIDVSGQVVTPGWIDIHTHLREPGGSHKETIRTGTLAAAAGGFTSIACMANTKPVNDNPFITSYLYQRIALESPVNVYVIGAVTKGLLGEELAEIGSMAEAGIVGISDDGKTVMNSYVMRKAMDYSKRFQLTVISHAEDACLKGKGVMNEGFNSARFGLRGVPKASEEIIVARDIQLAELTGARLHIAHVSTAGSVKLIREAKRRGLPVTGEATPHHLSLTDEAVAQYDTNTKVAPPLREPQDVEALLEGLSDGTIDVLASDHAPHAIEEKAVEYDLAEFGMVGLETAFPLYYQQVHKKRISLEQMVKAMTVHAAQVIGVPKGTLRIGSDADITVFNPSIAYTIDPSTFQSKSRNTPFGGWNVQGKVMLTIVAGRPVYRAL